MPHKTEIFLQNPLSNPWEVIDYPRFSASHYRDGKSGKFSKRSRRGLRRKRKMNPGGLLAIMNAKRKRRHKTHRRRHNAAHRRVSRRSHRRHRRNPVMALTRMASGKLPGVSISAAQGVGVLSGLIAGKMIPTLVLPMRLQDSWWKRSLGGVGVGVVIAMIPAKSEQGRRAKEAAVLGAVGSALLEPAENLVSRLVAAVKRTTVAASGTSAMIEGGGTAVLVDNASVSAMVGGDSADGTSGFGDSDNSGSSNW